MIRPSRLLLIALAATSFAGPARAGDPYADITADEIRLHVSALVQCSRRSRAEGDVLWGRIAGQVGEKLAARYVEGVMNRIGLKGRYRQPGVVFHEWQPQILKWWPTRLEVRLEDGGPPLRSAMAKGFSTPTPGTDGVVAPLVDIDVGDNLDQIDLRGKIALVRSVPTWSIYRHSAQEVLPLLADRGALGAIFWVDQPAWPDDMQYAANPGDLVWVPWVCVDRREGLLLRKYAAGRRVRLIVNAEFLDDWTTQNVVGVLHGNEAAREYVLVMAHLDGFFEAANDNASGVAALLAIARHYSAVPQEQRARHIIFAATGAHHESGLGAERLQQGLETAVTNFFDRCPLIINLEHLASANLWDDDAQNLSMLMIANGTPPLTERVLGRWFSEGCARYGVRLSPVLWPELHGDSRYLIDTGVPNAGMMELFTWYHSSYDDFEHVRPDAIARVTKAYCHVLDKVVLSGSRARTQRRTGGTPVPTFRTPR